MRPCSSKISGKVIFFFFTAVLVLAGSLYASDEKKIREDNDPDEVMKEEARKALDSLQQGAGNK